MNYVVIVTIDWPRQRERPLGHLVRTSLSAPALGLDQWHCQRGTVLALRLSRARFFGVSRFRGPPRCRLFPYGECRTRGISLHVIVLLILKPHTLP